MKMGWLVVAKAHNLDQQKVTQQMLLFEYSKFGVELPNTSTVDCCWVLNRWCQGNSIRQNCLKVCDRLRSTQRKLVVDDLRSVVYGGGEAR